MRSPFGYQAAASSGDQVGPKVDDLHGVRVG